MSRVKHALVGPTTPLFRRPNFLVLRAPKTEDCEVKTEKGSSWNGGVHITACGELDLEVDRRNLRSAAFVSGEKEKRRASEDCLAGAKSRLLVLGGSSGKSKGACLPLWEDCVWSCLSC